MCELQRAESAASERGFVASSASSEQCVERNRADEAFQGVEIGDHGGVRARRGRFGGAAVEWEECGSGGGERRASSDRGVVCGEGRKGSGEWGVQTGEEGEGERVRGRGSVGGAAGDEGRNGGRSDAKAAAIGV